MATKLTVSGATLSTKPNPQLNALQRASGALNGVSTMPGNQTFNSMSSNMAQSSISKAGPATMGPIPKAYASTGSTATAGTGTTAPAQPGPVSAPPGASSGGNPPLNTGYGSGSTYNPQVDALNRAGGTGTGNGETLMNPAFNSPYFGQGAQMVTENMAPTQAELDLSKKLANLNVSKQAGLNAAETEGAPLLAIQGEQGRIERRAQAEGQTLSEQLSALQQARQARLTAGQELYGFGTQEFNRNQPLSTPLGTQLISPRSGKAVGGILSPNDSTGFNMNDVVDSIMKGDLAPSEAYARLPSPYLQNALQAAILAKGGNINELEAKAQAQKSNVLVGGTAGVNAAQNVFQQSYKEYNDLQNATSNIDQFGELLTKTMSDGGINPSDVKYANQKIADVRNQLSSAQQAVFDNTMTSLRSRISGLLAAGGSEVPTAITADAQKIMDGSLPLGALSQVLQRIQQEGQVLLQNKAKIVNDNFQRIQSGGTQNGGASGTVNANMGERRVINGQTYQRAVVNGVSGWQLVK